jgi:hypothetical protein
VFQDAFGVRFNPDAVFSYDANSENFSVRLPADPTYHPYDPYDPQSGCDPPLSYDQVYNPILEGVPSLLYNGGCSLTVDPSKLGFLVTGGCLDIADVEPSFPPLLAATTLEGGRAVFFGDTDSVAANQQLFTNIVNWLKKPEALPSPPPVPGPTEAGPIPVTINIIPWCKENKIDLQSKGVIRVAVLSTPDFDVKQVHPKTVLFAEAKPLCWMRMDVDRDGDKDLLLLFPIHDLKLTEESTGAVLAVLTGKTLDGKSFEGKDMVQIVEHKKCKKPEKPDNKGNNCGGKKGK